MKQEPTYCDVCAAAGQKTIGFKKVKIQHPVTGELLMEQNFCEDCYVEFLKQANVELDSRIAASEFGRKGGSAPHNRPKDYFSKIASLPRKRKNAKK